MTPDDVVVQTNDAQQINRHADGKPLAFTVEHGALVIYATGAPVRAYAPGQWQRAWLAPQTDHAEYEECDPPPA